MSVHPVVRIPQGINKYYSYLSLKILLYARKELLVRLEKCRSELHSDLFFSLKGYLEELVIEQIDFFSSLDVGKFLPLLAKVGSTSQQFTSKSIKDGELLSLLWKVECALLCITVCIT